MNLELYIQNMLHDEVSWMSKFFPLKFQELIALLEEESLEVELNAEHQNRSGIEITECISYIKSNSFSFLDDRPTLMVHYDENNISRIITVHGVNYFLKPPFLQ